MDQVNSNEELLKQMKAFVEQIGGGDVETPTLDKLVDGRNEEKKQKLIDNGFYRTYPIKNSNGDITDWKSEPDYYAFARYVMENFSLMTDDSYRLIYENNCYNHASKTKMMNLVCSLTKDKAKPNEVDNFFKITTAKAYKKKIDITDPYRKINLNNGVYDLEKKELLDHSPKYFFRYSLNHKYDAEATCPNFIKFLNFVLNSDQELIALTQQMFGYILMGGDPIAHRAFLLYGDGRNGKSTLLDTLRSLVGESNCSAVSMKAIDKPFSMVQMDGKLANIVEESPAQIDAEAFKNIVGGGTITASYKGKDEFQMKINVRLVFACNSLPTFKDSTSGTNDRLIILPFNRYIKPDERDTGIKNKIFNEMSGILNWAIEGYDSFKSNGYKFIQSETVSRTLDEYRSETDTVYSWCKDNIEKTSIDNALIVCKIAYDAYSDECKDDGYGPVGKRKFLTRVRNYALQEFGIDVNSDTKKVLGKSAKVYFGLLCKSKKYVEFKGNLEQKYVDELNLSKRWQK